MTDLARFHAVEAAIHLRALEEIERGRKDSHWMWFVFPQLRGLGRSPTALHYGLDPEEAAPFLADPILGPRLVQIAHALMIHAGPRSAEAIFGPVDALKLRSSMTLFAAQPGADPVFGQVLSAFCDGPCPQTLVLLQKTRANRAEPRG
ncbi:DUF1810 domain-containing protein [Tabrizicola sp.]|uniref:DUF1810 domain-containing protein n=1 Tax=Tabrizicola sp. TaxID=2005166 RepID=UPI002FDC8751